MEIKTGEKYVILVNAGGILTYIATILSQDSQFITFIDIKDVVYTFNKNSIVSFTIFNPNYKKGGKNGDDNR